MNASRLLAAGILACVLAASARTDDKREHPNQGKLLVGKWDVTRSGDRRGLPVGSTIEFGKDGKMQITLRDEAQIIEETTRATYELKGDKIEYLLKLDPGKEEDPRIATIKEISDRVLVLELDKDQTCAFKRAEDKKEESPFARLVVGKWEVTRATKDVPAGSTFEFGKDGRLECVFPENGAVVSSHAFYKVKGDKIWYRLTPGAKPVGAPRSFPVKKVTNEELILEFEKDQPVEFKRKK